MSLKAVFIDVGNTLLYEKPSRFEIYAESARSRGLALATDEMTALMRRAHRELPRVIDGAFRYSEGWFAIYIERIFHQYLGISKSELPELSEELFARFSRPETFALYPGGDELLRALRARFLRIGIVSNWSARLPGLLARLGLADRVDFIVCSAIERAEKPDREIFERALARAGVEPGDAIHAGDDLEKDVRGARSAGIASILVDHAGSRNGVQHGADHRVESLHELTRLVATLA